MIPASETEMGSAPVEMETTIVESSEMAAPPMGDEMEMADEEEMAGEEEDMGDEDEEEGM